MLRNIVLALGAALLATALVGAYHRAYGAAVFCAAWGAIMVFGIVYERYAYKTVVDKIPAGKGWTRSRERLVDKKSGRTVTVYVKSLTGERAYVAEKLTDPPAAEG
jgi:hypothetical protein